MKRIFFNGVSKFSYDGQFVSFALDDTKPDSQLGTSKDIVFSGICDLRALKGIVNFLNNQIQEIEKRDNKSLNENISLNEIEANNKTETLVILKPSDIDNHE